MHVTYKATFDIVFNNVDKVMVQQWRKVERNSDPISWCRSRRSLCGLLMSQAGLQAVLDAGADWKNTAEEHMVKCISGGSELATRLFSGCVAAVLVSKVEKEMETFAAGLLKFRPTGDTIGLKEADAYRIKWLAKINAIPGGLV